MGLSGKEGDTLSTYVGCSCTSYDCKDTGQCKKGIENLFGCYLSYGKGRQDCNGKEDKPQLEGFLFQENNGAAESG